MSTPKPGNSTLYSISQQDPQSLPGFWGFPHHIIAYWRAKTPEGPLKPAHPRHPHQLSKRFSYSGTTSASKKWRGLWRWEQHSGSFLTRTWFTQLPSPHLLDLDSTTAFGLHKILLKAQGTALSTHTCVAILPLTHSSRWAGPPQPSRYGGGFLHYMLVTHVLLSSP